jgi:hypothetical protein
MRKSENALRNNRNMFGHVELCELGRVGQCRLLSRNTTNPPISAAVISWFFWCPTKNPVMDVQSTSPQPTEPISVWIVSLVCAIIVLISVALASVGTTNPVQVQVIVSIPPDFTDGFTMQKSLTTDTCEILGTTNVSQTHTTEDVQTSALVATQTLVIGSQTMTPANVASFSVTNNFLFLKLGQDVVLTIPAHANTSLFLGLGAFTKPNFVVQPGSNAALFDFKSNNTAIALANLPAGGYNIVLSLNGPGASQSANTKLVPVLVAYDDSIQEWVNFKPGLLSSVDFMQSQIGAKYIWSVTFKFLATGAFATFPVFPSALRLGFQIFVQYGVGQLQAVVWNITELEFLAIKVL